MTDERLSKEEINALFQETAAGKEGDHVRFHEIEKEALSELFSVAIGSLTTTLSSVFMQDVFVSNVTMQFLPEDRLQQEVPLPYVEAAIRYEGAAAGHTIMMVNPPDAQDMADIWLVAKGDEGDPSVDKSLTTVMTGMMESLHKGLSMASGSSFSGTFTNLQVVSELTNSVLLENAPESVYVDITFELSIGSIVQTVVHHVIPATVAKQISELLVSAEDLQDAEKQEIEKAKEQEAEVHPKSLNEPEQVSEEKESMDSFASRVTEPEPSIQNVQFTNFSQEDHPYSEQRNLNMLLDIPLQVTVELGRTKRIVKDILELSHGSILELDKLAGEPVDILINSKLIAKGEVVVIDENFGVRVTDILSAAERLSKLR